MKGIVAEVMRKFPCALLGLYSKGTELPQFCGRAIVLLT